MCMRKLIGSATALFALLSFAGCGDATLPEVAPVAAHTLIAVRGWNDVAPGRTAFPCTFEAGPGALRPGDATISFPRSELDPAGRSRLYIYRGYSGDRVVFVAWCAIPATEAAVQRMDRRFRYKRAERAFGTMGTTNCVTTKEGCLLAPVTVTACVGGNDFPDCGGSSGQPEENDYCSDFGFCGGGGADNGSGGGGGNGSEGGETGTGTPAPCKSGDPMIDSPGVWGQFANLWARSIASGVEQGGWVLRGADGRYSLSPFQNAVFTACGIDIHEPAPAGAVSMFHTHPWPLWADTPCGSENTGTPSSEDVAGLQQAGFGRGFFADASGIGIYTPFNGESVSRTGRCGY